MPYWLTNPDHGVMPVYSMSEVTQAQSCGWALLNHGESPNLPPKARKGVFEDARDIGEVRDSFSFVEAPSPAAEALKDALAESMRLDPSPAWSTSADPAAVPAEWTPLKRKPGRPPRAK